MKLKSAVRGVLAGAVSLTFSPTSALALGAPLTQGYIAPYSPQEPWEAPPGEYQEIGRRGFHDGIEGARKDYENHRRPSVNNRDEYRHPKDVPREARRDYRDAFRRGYDAGVQHMMNQGGEHRDHDHDHDHN